MKWVSVPPNPIQSGPIDSLQAFMRNIDVETLRIMKKGTGDKEFLSHLPTIMILDQVSRHRWAQITEDNLKPQIDYGKEAFWLCTFSVPTFLVGKYPGGTGDRVTRMLRITHTMMSHIRRLDMYKATYFVHVDLVKNRGVSSNYSTDHRIVKL